jgi:hypothetical protein
MRINGKAFFAVMAVGTMLLVGCSAASPIRRSEASIRASLLKRTPPGTPKAHVESFMARQTRWEWGGDRWLDPRAGAQFTMKRVAERAGGPPLRNEVTHMLRAEFGSYLTWPFFHRYVYGYWGFDSNDDLVDIWIYKETDAL